MVWRKSSAMDGFLRRMADVLRQLPAGLLDPHAAVTPLASDSPAPAKRKSRR
jgi:LysR family hydrogen peroxide-inducible transcriptional activator